MPTEQDLSEDILARIEAAYTRLTGDTLVITGSDAASIVAESVAGSMVTRLRLADNAAVANLPGPNLSLIHI